MCERWSAIVIRLYERALIAALFLSACGDSQVFVPLPAGSDDRSMLIAVEKAGQIVRATAFDLEGDIPPIRVTAEDEQTLFLRAIGYSLPLRELGLEAGEVAIVGSEGVSLPLDGRVISAEVKRDELIVWSPDTPSAALIGARMRRVEPSSCADFTLDERPLPGSVPGVEGVYPFQDRAGLIPNNNGGVYRVDAAASTISIQPIDTSTRSPLSGAFVEPDGFTWMLLKSGELWTGRQGEALEHVLTSTVLASPNSELSGGGDPIEMYAFTSNGVLARIDGGRVTVLGNRVGPRIEFFDVLWLGPEELLIVGIDGLAIAHYLRGRFTSTTPDLRPNDVPRVVIRSAFGEVLGTETGELFVRRAARWDRLVDRPGAVTSGLRVLASFEGGLLAGGENGQLVQVTPDLTLCAPRFYGGSDAKGLAQVGRDVVFGRRSPADSGEAIAVYLHRK